MLPRWNKAREWNIPRRPDRRIRLAPEWPGALATSGYQTLKRNSTTSPSRMT